MGNGRKDLHSAFSHKFKKWKDRCLSLLGQPWQKTVDLAAEIRENYFLPLLDAGKSKIKISAGCGSWWGSLTGLQMATFFLHSNMVEMESSPVSFSLYQASALSGHLNLMTSLQALSPSTVTLRARASTYEQGWVCVQNSVNGPNYSLINKNHCVFELII